MTFKQFSSHPSFCDLRDNVLKWALKTLSGQGSSCEYTVHIVTDANGATMAFMLAAISVPIVVP